MIRDLSETLKALLGQDLVNTDILFDRPSDPYQHDKTVVNLFLYDIRENVELRSSEVIVERKNDQAIFHPAPRRVACTYLVTAWPTGGTELALQEHRLLSQVLQILSRYPKIPASFLKGSLVGQEPPLPMITAQADGLKNPAEFWTALGNKLRPSLTVTVTISMDVFAPQTAAIVITEEIDIGARTSPGEETVQPATLEKFFRIGGRVTDAAHAPVPGATILVVERGSTSTTDAEGYYRIGPIPSGNYTLRAKKDASEVTKNIAVPAQAGENYNMQFV
jgi:hypothetical protein